MGQSLASFEYPPLIGAKHLRDILVSGSHHNHHNRQYLVVSVLPDAFLQTEQLLPTTLSPEKEEEVINRILETGEIDQVTLILYGKNNTDTKVFEKYKKLHDRFGLNCVLYLGGMFEWLLLQKLHGEEAYPTALLNKNTSTTNPQEKWEKWG
jgi:hypothetical protein